MVEQIQKTKEYNIVKYKPYMLKIVKILTQNIADEFINKGEQSGIRVLTNTITKEVYLLPEEIEHIELACTLLKLNKKDLMKNPSQASHFVSSVITIDNQGTIISIITGISSLELKGNVRHKRETLEEGHRIINECISKGNVPQDIKQNVILYKFVEDGEAYQGAVQ